MGDSETAIVVCWMNRNGYVKLNWRTFVWRTSNWFCDLIGDILHERFNQNVEDTVSVNWYQMIRQISASPLSLFVINQYLQWDENLTHFSNERSFHFSKLSNELIVDVFDDFSFLFFIPSVSFNSFLSFANSYWIDGVFSLQSLATIFYVLVINW